MAAVSDATAGRRPGRPYRLPEDATPLTHVHGGVEARIAWLLGSSRVFTTDPALVHREDFVASLRAAGASADQARVSRWESGNLKVPARVIAAYEHVLGLSAGSLAVTIDGLRAALTPERAPDPEGPPAGNWHRLLDELFDRVTRDVADGTDWLRLARCLGTRPDAYLRPEAWTEIAEQLVRDASRSVGVERIRRFEALRALVRHPEGQVPAVKAIGAFVTDPAAQLVAQPLSLLQEVEDPQAGEVLLRMLAGGTSRVQAGAAWAVAGKLARGHLSGQPLARLEALLLHRLPARHPRRHDAGLLDVAARLPHEMGRRILRATQESWPSTPLDLVLQHGELLSSPVTRHVAAKMGEATQTATPAPYRIEPDLMLQRLIREALFHGHRERRHQASLLLMVSPYRAALAAVCADAADRSDGDLGVPAAGLLAYLATEDQRDLLLGWAADQSRPLIGAPAALALGQLREPLTPREEQALVKALHGDTGAATQHATMYALGMHGARALTDLAANGDEQQRRAATWWTRIGPAIHEKAQAR